MVSKCLDLALRSRKDIASYTYWHAHAIASAGQISVCLHLNFQNPGSLFQAVHKLLRRMAARRRTG